MRRSFRSFCGWIGAPAAALVQLRVATEGLLTAGVRLRCCSLPILRTSARTLPVLACALKVAQRLSRRAGCGGVQRTAHEARRSAALCRIADVVSAVDAIGAAGAAEPRQTILWVARISALMPLPGAPTFWVTEASTSKLTRCPLLKGGRLLPVPGGALSLFAMVPGRSLPQSRAIPVLPVPRALLTVATEPR